MDIFLKPETNMVIKDKPVIILAHEAAKKLMYFVDKTSNEVGLMGKSILRKNSADEYTEIYIKDLYLVDQEVHGSTTEIDPTALANLIYDTREVEGNLNVWIHSHVTMPVSWSGQDNTQIKAFGSGGSCIALVVNKKREVRASIYFHSDGKIMPNIWLDGIDVTVEQALPLSTAEISALDAEFEAKVKPKTYARPASTHTNSNVYGSGYNRNTGGASGKQAADILNFGGKTNSGTATASKDIRTKAEKIASARSIRDYSQIFELNDVGDWITHPDDTFVLGQIDPKNPHLRYVGDGHSKHMWINYKKFWEDLICHVEPISIVGLDNVTGRRTAYIKELLNTNWISHWATDLEVNELFEDEFFGFNQALRDTTED